MLSKKGSVLSINQFFFSLFTNNLEANIGVNVSATNEEIITAPDTTILNSRNSRPVIPSKKTMGKNLVFKTKFFFTLINNRLF